MLPDTSFDDEPIRYAEADLAPFRGCLKGCFWGALIWTPIVLLTLGSFMVGVENSREAAQSRQEAFIASPRTAGMAGIR